MREGAGRRHTSLTIEHEYLDHHPCPFFISITKTKGRYFRIRKQERRAKTKKRSEREGHCRARPQVTERAREKKKTLRYSSRYKD
jgi:hypothetical protein